MTMSPVLAAGQGRTSVLGALLLLAGCQGTPVDGSLDPKAPRDVTRPVEAVFAPRISPWGALADVPLLDAQRQWRDGLSVEFQTPADTLWRPIERVDAGGACPGSDTGPDGEGSPDDADGSEDPGTGDPRVRLARGEYRFRVVDRCGLLTPAETRLVKLPLGERETLAVEMQRRAVVYRGSTRVLGDVAGDTTLTAELRWHADSARPCHERQRVGTPVALTAGAAFEIAGQAFVGGATCVYITAGSRLTLSEEIEPDLPEACPCEVTAEARGSSPRVVDLGEIDIRVAEARVSAAGFASARNGLQRDDFASPPDDGPSCAPGGALLEGPAIGERLIIVDARLGDGLGFPSQAVEDGEEMSATSQPEPACAEVAAESVVTRVGLYEVDDRLRGAQPVMVPVNALPRDAAGVPYLGAITPAGCVEGRRAADVAAGLAGDVAGVHGRRLRLPYCLSGRGSGALSMVFETVAGARFEVPVSVTVDRGASARVRLVPEPAVPRGDLWFTRESEVRVVSDPGVGADFEVVVAQAEEDDGDGPPCPGPAGAVSAIGGTAESGRWVSAPVRLPAPTPISDDADAYGEARLDLCAYARRGIGPWQTTRLALVRVTGRPEGWFRLTRDAPAVAGCPLETMPPLQPGGPACVWDQELVGPRIALQLGIAEGTPRAPSPFIERQVDIDALRTAPVGFSTRAFVIDLGAGVDGQAHSVRVRAQDVFGQWHALRNAADDTTVLSVRSDDQAPRLRRLSLLTCDRCRELPRDCPDEPGGCDWLRRCNDTCVPESAVGVEDALGRTTTLIHPARPLPLLFETGGPANGSDELCGVLSLDSLRLGQVANGRRVTRAVEVDRAGTAALTEPATLCARRHQLLSVAARAVDRACLTSVEDSQWIVPDDVPPSVSDASVECARIEVARRDPDAPWLVPDDRVVLDTLEACGDRRSVGRVTFTLDDTGSGLAGRQIRYRVVGVPTATAPWQGGHVAGSPRCNGDAVAGRTEVPECGADGWRCTPPGREISLWADELSIDRWPGARILPDICLPEARTIPVQLWVEASDVAGNVSRLRLSAAVVELVVDPTAPPLSLRPLGAGPEIDCVQECNDEPPTEAEAAEPDPPLQPVVSCPLRPGE